MNTVLVRLLVVGLLWPVSVMAQTVNTADREDIRVVIEGQLAAFQADDAVKAFSFAAPAIQQQFGNNPQVFLEMVKTGYQPVYRPRSVLFGELKNEAQVVVQELYIIDSEGRSLVALYAMEQQGDGSWRIAGCVLQAGEGRFL